MAPCITVLICPFEEHPATGTLGYSGVVLSDGMRVQYVHQLRVVNGNTCTSSCALISTTCNTQSLVWSLWILFLKVNNLHSNLTYRRKSEYLEKLTRSNTCRLSYPLKIRKLKTRAPQGRLSITLWISNFRPQMPPLTLTFDL